MAKRKGKVRREKIYPKVDYESQYVRPNTVEVPDHSNYIEAGRGDRPWHIKIPRQ